MVMVPAALPPCGAVGPSGLDFIRNPNEIQAKLVSGPPRQGQGLSGDHTMGGGGDLRPAIIYKVDFSQLSWEVFQPKLLLDDLYG